MPDPRTALLDELRRVSAVLDELIAAMSADEPSQPRHDRYVDQVEGLCARMRRAARGPGRTVSPPSAPRSRQPQVR
jgi:hypothetical protein